MVDPVRSAPDKARRPRQTLSLGVWQSRNTNSQASVGDPQFNPSMDETQRFEAWLWAERNRWDIDRRRCGLIGAGKLDRANADRALARLLAAQMGETLR